MAGIDYTTVVMECGNRVAFIKVGDYELSAYKGYLTFAKDGKETMVIGENEIRQIPEATDVRTIPLISEKDVKESLQECVAMYQRVFDKYYIISKKTRKEKNIRSILLKNLYLTEDFIKPALHMFIFKIADCTIFYFPNNPAFGGASYAYVLDDGKNSLSIIISGYGHYKNPLLHWIDRGLTKESEEELISTVWEHMIHSRTFCQLFVEQCFMGYTYHIDGGLTSGYVDEDTINDEDVIRLYNILNKLEEE